MKKQSGKKLKLVLVILAVMVIGLVGGAGMIFREELKIANSVRPVDGKEHVYYMEVDSDMPYDIVLYTRKEFDELKDDEGTFAWKIYNSGAVLYG